MTRSNAEIIADIQRDLAELRARLAEDGTALSPTPVHATADDFNLTLKQAAAIAGRREPTLVAWIRKHQIGGKQVGRWVVSERRLRALLACGTS